MKHKKQIITFPEAFAFIEKTKKKDHHEKCSWHHGILCDCDILNLMVGREYEMAFPFQKEKYGAIKLSKFMPGQDAFHIWTPGCDVHIEQYSECHGERFFTAHGE